MSGRKLRAFVALDLDDAARRRILDVMAGLQADLRGVRWVRPQGVHVTVRFLGWTDEEALASLQASLAAAARECPPADVALGPLGMFPDRGAPRVIWVGLDFPQPMFALQRACEEAARRLGFEPEERAFRPHVTLGRWSDRATRPQLPPVELGIARIDHLTLYRSELRPSGAEYTPLRVFPLGP